MICIDGCYARRWRHVHAHVWAHADTQWKGHPSFKLNVFSQLWIWMSQLCYLIEQLTARLHSFTSCICIIWGLLALTVALLGREHGTFCDYCPALW